MVQYVFAAILLRDDCGTFYFLRNRVLQFKNGSWIEVDGIIEKGYYHGDIPVIKIKNIKETNIPKDEFVYPPDNNYIESEV